MPARGDVAQKTFYSNDQRSRVDVLEAETFKADGRRIQVRPDQIRLQEEDLRWPAPLVFPEIEKRRAGPSIGGVKSSLRLTTWSSVQRVWFRHHASDAWKKRLAAWIGRGWLKAFLHLRFRFFPR